MESVGLGARLKTPTVPALIFIAAGMAYAAGHGDKRLDSGLAALGAALLIGMTVWQNRRSWSADRAGAQSAAVLNAASGNVLWLGLAYGWGALAMLASYYLTPLAWYHAYQYGGIMAVLGFCWLRDVKRLDEPSPGFDRPRLAHQIYVAALAQAVAAAVGVAILILSGKVLHERADWAANRVFIAGGVAVAVISAITAATHRRLCGADPSRS